MTDTVPSGVAEDELLRLSAAAQGGSEHPLAHAVLARAEGILVPAIEDS